MEFANMSMQLLEFLRWQPSVILTKQLNSLKLALLTLSAPGKISKNVSCLSIAYESCFLAPEPAKKK